MTINRADNDFLQLRTMIANMCHMVLSMLEDTVKAIMEQDEDLAASVTARDKEVDALDLQIDNYCLKFLALYGPKAADLRTVVASLRRIVDIERIGDHCKFISRQVRKHHYAPAIQYTEGFNSLLTFTKQILQDAITAVFEENVEKAMVVISMDATIDKIYSSISKQLITGLAEDVSKARLIFSFINIIRRFERIADHATNIAETVPYIVSGALIRHNELNVEKPV